MPPAGLTLCLHRGTSPISRVIQWFTRSEYSHASVILPDGRHAEAREGRGVIMHRAFVPLRGESVDFFALAEPLTLLETARFLEFVESTLGAPYDYRMAAAFFWRGSASAASAEAYFCSEWLYEGLLAAGRQLLRTTEGWRVSPRDLGLSPLILQISLPLAA